MTRALSAGEGLESRRGSTGAGYFERSERPLTSLLFLLPMIVVYELGTRFYAVSSGRAPEHIYAFTLMQRFFLMLGATGRLLPALAVAGILIAWHLARKDPWEFRPRTLVGMFFESVLLAFPLIAMSALLAHYLPRVLMAATPARPTGMDLLILPLGAGVYEELVFRLILLTVLSLLFKDAMKAPPALAGAAVVLLSALAFSGYHHLGSEPFGWPRFIFRTLAGIYLGVVFLCRGFGIAAASHAAYDVLIGLM
jgi:hypothetical protein